MLRLSHGLLNLHRVLFHPFSRTHKTHQQIMAYSRDFMPTGQFIEALPHFGVVDGNPVPECIGLVNLHTFEVSTNRKANGEWCTCEEVTLITF